MSTGGHVDRLHSRCDRAQRQPGPGARPTTDTGKALVDALLWIRTPGESDGPCFCGLGGPEDPERGLVDPAAGLWLAEQARELIELAELALGGPSMRGPKH
jgi:endoglucanase